MEHTINFVFNTSSLKTGAFRTTKKQEKIIFVLSVVLAVIFGYSFYDHITAWTSTYSKVMSDVLVVIFMFCALYMFLELVFSFISSLLKSKQLIYLGELEKHNNEMIYVIDQVLEKYKENHFKKGEIALYKKELTKKYPHALDYYHITEPKEIQRDLLTKFIKTIEKLDKTANKINLQFFNQLTFISALSRAMADFEMSEDDFVDTLCDASELYLLALRQQVELKKQLRQREVLKTKIYNLKTT